MLTSNRLEQIEQDVKKAKALDLDVDTIKTKVENMAYKDDIEQIREKLGEMVPIKHFEDLMSDFHDLQRDIVKHNEFNIVIEEHNFLKNDVAKCIQKDEYVQRFTALHEHFIKMFEHRPTHDQLKKQFKGVEEKIEESQKLTQKWRDFLQSQINKHNSEFTQIGKELDGV